MSSMKFFRNSVLLSEAFRSLQYSLRMGRGEKSGLGGLDRAEGLRLPNRPAWPSAEKPGPQLGTVYSCWLGPCVPCRLPRLGVVGRADTRRMVHFLQSGRFSLLGIAPQSLPPLLCSWTEMAHRGGPRKGLMAGSSPCTLKYLRAPGA